MNFRYDLHIHSCLSPCCDDEMTPANIVNMASVMDLSLIALTDHNSTANCRAAVAAGQQAGIVVVPGMELCTAEEIHVICLFPDPDAADAFGTMVYETLPDIQNQPAIFGNQIWMDSADRVLGYEDRLLTTASSISIDALPALCRQYGGCSYPAHIDRPSFSILAVFGMLDEGMGFSCAEITSHGDIPALVRQHPALGAMHLLHSSDAHALEMMAGDSHSIALPECSAAALIRKLQN